VIKRIELTIENLLESSIRFIQDSFGNDDEVNKGKDNLIHLCAGIVAGIKSQKKEADDGND
jgi:hypothetical protein